MNKHWRRVYAPGDWRREVKPGFWQALSRWLCGHGF